MASHGTRLSWLDRFYAVRDGLLASPRFQRWAMSFPLIRIIARQRAQGLFDLCAGFVYSQILLSCARLKVFDALREGPQRTDDLAKLWKLSTPAAERLLSAAAALELTERRGPGRYGLGMQGAALIANPYILDMVEHHAILYGDLADPVALLRGEHGGETRLAAYWPYAGKPAFAGTSSSAAAGYTHIMAQSLRDIAEDVLDAYPIQRHRALLDVGGGAGVFVEAAARRAPNLSLKLFDLPAVADAARARLATVNLGQRIEVVGGSFLADSLPGGADVISLVRIVHDHEDASVLTLLRSIHRALSEGGTLLIAEPMSGVAGAEKVSDAYFGFYLLAMGAGRARSIGEIAQLLDAAGFASPHLIRTRRPFLTSLIKVQKK